jgi:hypothetical protein
MTDPSRRPQIEAPRPIRAERLAAGVVAQYIHELSGHGSVGAEDRSERDASAAGEAVSA